MERTYGLCLAGGGGKGSYEVGVWRALRTLGKDKEIKAVSGASIGALNAVFVASDGFDNAMKQWRQIKNSDFLHVSTSTGYCSRDRLIEIIRSSVDFDALKFSDIRCFVNVSMVQEYSYLPDGLIGLGKDYLSYPSVTAIKDAVKRSVQEMEPEYIELNKLDPDRIIQILLASSAMPVVYPPVIMDGKKYIDGGMVDNLPIRPLIEDAECKNLIVVKLSKGNEYDVYLASRAENIIEITPSKSVGDGLIDGTLDFNPDHVEFRLQLGYFDTLRAFDVLERKQMGIPYSRAELAEKERKDLEKVEQMARAGNSVNRMVETKNKFDDLLGKYSDKYGIDLKFKKD